jgi:Flp pilus assembly pilin Flp
MLMASSNVFRRVIVENRAATAVEYSLVAAGVALAVAATVMNVGSTIKSTFYDRLLALF